MQKNTILLTMLLLCTYCINAQIVPFGDTWKYLDDGSNQGTAWRAVSFDDNSWRAGRAELGYGDGDEATVVSYGDDPKSKYITTYFRKTFTISDVSAFNSFKGKIKRDDGAVVYINGREVFRTNMSSGSIEYNTLASKSAGGEDGTKIHSFILDPDVLVSGTNVIAVEVHQFKVNNSDISFDFKLEGFLATGTGDGGGTDLTPPSVLSIDRFSPSDDTTNATSVTFRAAFSESVTGVDASDFSLSGTAGGAIVSVSGNGSVYDIKVNVNGTGNLGLDLNTSGTGIKDTSGNAITGGFTDGETYVITNATNPDDTPPAVESIVRYNPTVQSTTATTVTFRITFTEDVDGVNASDFAIKGTAGGSIVSVSGSGAIYDIKVNASGPGSLGIDLKSSGTGITDSAGNEIQEGFTAGETYNIVVNTQPSASLVHGPYLQMASETAITIRWRTDVATDSKIEAGTSFGTYTESATDDNKTTEHEVRITGLRADTKYFYRFGSSSQVLQAGQDNYFNTAPPLTTTKKIRVAAFGDCGSPNSVQKQVLNTYLNFAGSNPAELMLLLGDNAYEDGTDAEYHSNFFVPYGSTVLKNHDLFTVPGNHDYHTTSLTSRSAPYYTNFSLPTGGECGGVPSGTESYYSYNWGNIHFVGLDSYGEESDNTHLYDTLGPQVTWLKKDLAANASKWTIVYWHHPPFSKGSHNSDAESDLTKIRMHFIRILERYGVDLILCGHSHVYERSYLLRNYFGKEAEFDLSTDAVSSSSAKYNGSSNSCPYTTVDGKVDHGTVYVVSGSSSRDNSAVESTFPHDALPFATNAGGMFYFEVQDNRLDAKFVREDGVIYDQFTIMKGVNKTKTVSTTSGSSVTLTASWLGNYNWSNGATTRSITVAPVSDQTFSVTDNNKCLRDEFDIKLSASIVSSNVESKAGSLNNTNGKIEVFPTLIKKGGMLTILSRFNEVTDASMVDNNGRLIYNFKLTGTNHIETGNLAAGIYYIITNNKDKAIRQKIVIAE